MPAVRIHVLLFLLPLFIALPGYAAAPDSDATVALREAELRRALAEAERAEWLARLPPTTSKALAGSVDTSHAGVVALMKSVDLAGELARELCAALPPLGAVALYDPASSQGIVAARSVDDGILHITEQLTRQHRQLQQLIEQHSPPAGARAPLAMVPLAAIPATIKTAADIAALFKSDITLTGVAFGDGARALFGSALFKACPQRIAGLGTGYLGELDTRTHGALMARVRALAGLRGEYANQIAIADTLADAAKGAEKRLLASSVVNANAFLKTVDAFIESLKTGETGDKSPLFNAARFLAYAARTQDALLLDVDLRLEGVTLIKNGLFTGEKLRVAGAAVLWYRLHAPDGTLLQADALRRITAPVELDLRAAQPFQ
ncbi:hypothetical protein [Massilia sp. S19_KUP03_FR1]|uniref:hypothetical protein n=1 Tax=Massilia sp. S19_KUP03_FR1 TaxID=3025503 RepID=UPI002FCD7F05